MFSDRHLPADRPSEKQYADKGTDLPFTAEPQQQNDSALQNIFSDGLLKIP